MGSYNNTTTTNFDNLLLQTLMGRLQLRPPNPHTDPLISRTLEDILFDAASSMSDDEDDDENSKTPLAKEESKLEKEIIRNILSGKTETLKPNSGQAIAIGEHHICVGFHEESGSGYRVWEWHGHIMLFDEENGYTPEYIYGNYFQKVLVKPTAAVDENDDEEDQEEKETVGNMGLRELIDGGDPGKGRILHRNINAGSPR